MLNEYLDITDFDAAAQWAQDHGKADYMWSKQAICAYVAREAMALPEAGHPHQRDLPRARPTRRSRRPTRTCGSASAPTTAPRSASRPSTPLEQAYPLVFLCSDAASAINGQTVITDSGYFSSGITEIVPGRDAGRALPARPLRRVVTG